MRIVLPFLLVYVAATASADLVRLAHNLLHDSPHQSISLGGNDHVIELNEVHHISMDSDDCGAFYMGRNPSERGSIIRHNFWHHIGSTFSHGSCAVYFDDGSGGAGPTFASCASGADRHPT
jgi:hypothetical protein